jgi:hypothetical protein
MQATELKSLVVELGLTQADFARLVGVTSRAVTLWMTDERTIPGPVEAYLRVFMLLPANLRQIELNRLKQKGTAMRDGMYGISFQGRDSAGMGVLVFENGRVYGSDVAGVRYDGGYIYHEAAKAADVRVKVTFPPNVESVFGVKNPYEWSFDVTTALNPHANSGPLALKTSLGQPINAQFVYLRPLPETA